LPLPSAFVQLENGPLLFSPLFLSTFFLSSLSPQSTPFLFLISFNFPFRSLFHFFPSNSLRRMEGEGNRLSMSERGAQWSLLLFMRNSEKITAYET
jgi:hypothetical protein